MHVLDCKDLIAEHFKKDWEKLLDLSSSEDFIEKNQDFTGSLDTLIKKCFIHLNLSVLKGEYVINKEFTDDLTKLEDSLDFFSTINFEDDQLAKGIEEIITGTLLARVIDPLRFAIKEYRGFYCAIKNKCSYPYRVSILNAKSKDDSLIDRTSRTYLRQFIDFNIELARIDHNLAIKEEVLQKLLLFLDAITQKQGDDKVQAILKDKCSYLIIKILTKYKHDPLKYYYAINFEDKSLNINGFKAGVYGEFLNKTSLLQNNSNSDTSVCPAIREKVKNVKINFHKNEKLEKYEDFLLLISDLKKSSYSTKEIEKLIHCFNELGIESSCFNEAAFTISGIYFENNLISKNLESDKISIEEIKTIFHSVKDKQEETQIFNYYPFLKISKILINRGKIEIAKEIIDFECLNGIVVLLKSHIEEELFSSFEWCSDRNFLPFQLPFNECCLLKTDKDEKDKTFMNLFLASSFVLPVNYQKVKNEIDKIKREIDELNAKIEFHKSINKEKTELEKIKNEIQKTDRKHVEILSVFAAIVIFASSSVQVYKSSISLNDSLRFMLVFAYSLAMFIVLIWMITRVDGFSGKKLPWTHWIVILILVVATISAFYTVNHSQTEATPLPPAVIPKHTTMKVEKIGTKDSLKTLSNVKMANEDSLNL